MSTADTEQPFTRRQNLARLRPLGSESAKGEQQQGGSHLGADALAFRRVCPERWSWSGRRPCATPSKRRPSMDPSASPGGSATSGPCRTSTPSTTSPVGVRLTAYWGEANDLPAAVLQRFLDAVAAGVVTVAIGRTYRFDDIHRAHADMESGAVTGEFVAIAD
jgi:hypothetical protein